MSKQIVTNKREKEKAC